MAGGTKIIDPAVKQAALDDYANSGDTAVKVAERHGFNPSTIRKWVRAAGVKHDQGLPTAETKAAFADDYLNTRIIVADLASKYGISLSTAQAWSRELGGKKARPVATTDYPEDEIEYTGGWRRNRLGVFYPVKEAS